MIQNNFNTCAECNESIFNPICPNCLTREVEQWLKENNPLEKEKIKKVKKELSFYIGKSKKGQRCIICRKNSTFLCPYCFTKEVLNILKEAKVSNKILGEFFVYLNYDFEHTGYSKEAEKFELLC